MRRSAWELILVASLMAAAMQGCGGKAGSQSPLPEVVPAPPGGSAGAFGLPSPLDVLKGKPPSRQVSGAVLPLPGKSFQPLYYQRVSAVGDGAQFTPDWQGGGSQFASLAYAIYHFGMQGYSGTQTLQLSWGAVPQDYGNLWLGFSNWQANRWDWFAGPNNGVLELPSPGLGAHAKPDTGDMLVAVVLLGTHPCSLAELRVGGTLRGDWWMFGHDPQHTHRSPYVACQTGNLKWTFQTSGPGSPPRLPAVAPDGTMYFTCAGGLCAIGADGVEKWHLAIGQGLDGFSGTPAVGPDGTLYVAAATGGNHYVLSMGPDGAERWRYKLQDQASLSPSPAVGPDGVVRFCTQNYFWALKADGTREWSVRADLYESSPITVGPDGTSYVGTRGALSAFAADGSASWRLPLGNGGSMLSRPMIGPDGTVCVADGENDLCAVTDDGTLKWTLVLDSSIDASPAVGLDGTTFIGTTGGFFYAVDPSGQVKWQRETIRPVDSSAVIGPDGMVYLVDYYGVLYKFDPDGGEWWDTAVGTKTYYDLTLAGEDTLIVLGVDHKFHAYDTDGHEEWTYFVPGGAVGPNPVIAEDGTVYVGSDDQRLYAVSPDGSLEWSFDAGGPVGSSAAIGTDSAVYACGDWMLYALEASGALRWVRGGTLFGGSFSGTCTPTIGSDGVIYVVSKDAGVCAVKPSGSVSWRGVPAGSLQDPVVASDGTLYTIFGQDLLALNPDGTQRWTCAVGWSEGPLVIGPDGTIYAEIRYDVNHQARWALRAIDPAGAVKWSLDMEIASGAGLAVGADGTLFTADGFGRLCSISPSGSILWTSQAIKKVCSTPAIGGDGTLYMGGRDGKVYAGTESGELKWSYQTRGAVGSPAIGDNGAVYVGSEDGKLYAFAD